LGEWIIRLAEERAVGTYNAAGPAEPLSMAAMLSSVGAAVGSRSRLLWVQANFLERQKVSPWSDMPVWVPARGETAGFARRSIRRALAAGLTFRPLGTTASETLAWFRTQPAERQAKLRAGLTPEREAEVLAAWKASKGAAQGA
ncbi:MAG: hypothetical protein ACREEX_12630, partial [Caulobacteraceae bacterium]